MVSFGGVGQAIKEINEKSEENDVDNNQPFSIMSPSLTSKMGQLNL